MSDRRQRTVFEVEYTATLCGRVKVRAKDADEAQERVLALSDEVLGDPKRRIHQSLAVSSARIHTGDPDI